MQEDNAALVTVNRTQQSLAELVPAERLSIAGARLNRSIADSTAKAYERYISLYDRWREATGGLPHHPDVLIYFLSEMADGRNYNKKSWKYTALHKVVASLRWKHPDVYKAIEIIDRMLKNLRVETQGPKQVKPITEQEFGLIRAFAQRGEIEPRDLALIGVMRDAMLRSGEAVDVTWADISPRSNGTASLYISKSKTDQIGIGAYQFLTRRTVADLVAYAGSEVVLSNDLSCVFPITESQLRRRIQAACKVAGLGEGYSGHSCRIGMAIDLAKDKHSLPDIMNAGRWQSPEMPALYIRETEVDDGAVSRWASQRGI